MFAHPVAIYRTSTQNQYGLFWQNSIKIKSNNARQGKKKEEEANRQDTKETKTPPASNEECSCRCCTLVDSRLWSWWSGSLTKLDAVQSTNGQLMDKVMVG